MRGSKAFRFHRQNQQGKVFLRPLTDGLKCLLPLPSAAFFASASPILGKLFFLSATLILLQFILGGLGLNAVTLPKFIGEISTSDPSL